MLLETESTGATLDGENLEPGKSRSYTTPPLLKAAAGTIVFLLAVFKKGSGGPEGSSLR
jgi:hypothetical protein